MSTTRSNNTEVNSTLPDSDKMNLDKEWQKYSEELNQLEKTKEAVEVSKEKLKKNPIRRLFYPLSSNHRKIKKEIRKTLGEKADYIKTRNLDGLFEILTQEKEKYKRKNKTTRTLKTQEIADKTIQLKKTIQKELAEHNQISSETAQTIFDNRQIFSIPLIESPQKLIEQSKGNQSFLQKEISNVLLDMGRLNNELNSFVPVPLNKTNSNFATSGLICQRYNAAFVVKKDPKKEKGKIIQINPYKDKTFNKTNLDLPPKVSDNSATLFVPEAPEIIAIYQRRCQLVWKITKDISILINFLKLKNAAEEMKDRFDVTNQSNWIKEIKISKEKIEKLTKKICDNYEENTILSLECQAIPFKIKNEEKINAIRTEFYALQSKLKEETDALKECDHGNEYYSKFLEAQSENLELYANKR